ncbi:hypothetical protein [Arthrobacter sp. M4]|uniref:hypothetical protein n=1 Tax=Arthrobacter sp. M4 TaxID=218160 RepID=UPI001CDB63ED|nr:hypothetical protein [Arthrobacter sp. M4]MCA4132616.1 hypothetical protein [Arthrobacter sp. M4]
MGTHRKILDFTTIKNPRWRQVAREYLMARLAPLHPDVATLPQAFRAPMNPSSLWNELKRLTLWFNHLTAAGVSTLEQVRQHHCDEYLAVSRSITDPDRLLSPATTASMARAPQFLALYTEILTNRYRPGFTPWSGHSSDEVAGYVRGGENRVPPVPDTLLRPLLAGCLYLVERIAPLLAEEAARGKAADQRDAASRRGLPVVEISRLRAAIEQHREAGIPAPRTPTATVTRRPQYGWDPRDPLLHLGWTRSSSGTQERWAIAGTWSRSAPNWNAGSDSAACNTPGAAMQCSFPGTVTANKCPGRLRWPGTNSTQ